MRSSTGNTADKDRALVAAILAGKPDAIARFIQEVSGTVWASCRALSRYEGEARDSFIAIMAQLRDSGFAAFRDYDGRSTLKTFAALVVRDLRCRNVVQLFESDTEKAWRLFEQLFGADIRRLINRRLPAAECDELRRDFYQSVCLALIAQNYRRIRSYSGKGSFSGYILRCIDNVVRDEIRDHVAPRFRLPAAIARLGELERELFRLVIRDRIPGETELLAQQLRLRLARDFEPAEIEAALRRVRKHAKNLTLSAEPSEFDQSGEPSPEDRLINAGDEELLSAAVEVLAQAVRSLLEDERLYLMLMLGENPPPPRELARIMRRPVEEIYALKQRVLRKLRDLVSGHSAVKNWLTPV
jgi:RNA polymerase primary sigma factor